MTTNAIEVELLLKQLLKDTRFAGKTFAVGGFVRDGLLGTPPKDLDIVVEKPGLALELAELIHATFDMETTAPHKVGKSYPIWTVVFKEDVKFMGVVRPTAGAEIEIADPHRETFPDPNSRQRIVVPGTLEEDVMRRDFTVNMLLKEIVSGEIIDFSGVSMDDIHDGILRGHPRVEASKMFSDDPLRMLRLVRFMAKHGWRASDEVIEAVRANATRIKIVSGERIRDELTKFMELGHLVRALHEMEHLGLLEQVLPEVAALRRCEHDSSRGFHLEGDVLNHTRDVIRTCRPGVVPQLAALLHDVGKPATRQVNGDKVQFLKHEDVGADIAETVLRRLKFDASVIERVKRLVANHMKPHPLGKAKMTTIRRFVRKVGEDLIDELLDLAFADQLGNRGGELTIPEVKKRVREALAAAPISKRKPVLNGHVIMELLGVKPGPVIGRATQFLFEREDEILEGGGNPLTKEQASHILINKFEA